MSGQRDPVDVSIELTETYIAAFYTYHATFAKHCAAGWVPGTASEAPRAVTKSHADMIYAFEKLCEQLTGEQLPENWADPEVIEKHALP